MAVAVACVPRPTGLFASISSNLIVEHGASVCRPLSTAYERKIPVCVLCCVVCVVLCVCVCVCVCVCCVLCVVCVCACVCCVCVCMYRYG